MRALAAMGGAVVAGTDFTGTAAANQAEGAAQDDSGSSSDDDFEIDPFTLGDRLDQVETNRKSSLESLVLGLDDLEGTFNTEYETTVELYGTEFAPFLYTKGMPLETDEDDETLEEGLVAYDRKVGIYQKAILEQEAIDSSIEQGGDRVFIGVPAVHTVTHAGMDPWRGRMPPAPSPTGVRNAGEMVDAYAMEQLRDTPFVEYPNEPGGGDGLSAQEQAVFDALAKDEGGDFETIENELGESWWHSTGRLFVEADTDDVDCGPYLSQYLLHDVNMWALPIEQQYVSYEAGVDYNGTQSDWLTTIEGQDDISAEFNPKRPESDETSYISTGRDLATIVNADPTYQEYLIAGLHLLENSEFAEGLPYNSRSDGSIFDYTGSGPTGFLDLLARGARQALVAAFYQKYYVHFRCRPETYSGRVHFQRDGESSSNGNNGGGGNDGSDGNNGGSGNNGSDGNNGNNGNNGSSESNGNNGNDGNRDFGINDVLTDAEILSVRDNDADFLTTVFEEGSPLHPSYPSGHSVIAGACGTILKTLFENTDWNDDYYVPTADGNSRETIGVPSGHNGVYQEIDKLMSNIGLARMFAGVHYYSDHYWGVKLGEQVAVGFLYDFFERDYTGDEDLTATFTPFLEYDTEYDISIETVETLREQSLSR